MEENLQQKIDVSSQVEVQCPNVLLSEGNNKLTLLAVHHELAIKQDYITVVVPASEGLRKPGKSRPQRRKHKIYFHL